MSLEQSKTEGPHYYATLKIEDKDLGEFDFYIIVDDGDGSKHYNSLLDQSKKDYKSTKITKKYIEFDGHDITLDDYNCPHVRDIAQYVNAKGYTLNFYNIQRTYFQVRKMAKAYPKDIKTIEEEIDVTFSPPEHKRCANNKCNWTSYIIHNYNIIAYFQGEIDISEIDRKICNATVTNYAKINPDYEYYKELGGKKIKINLLKKLYKFTFEHLNKYKVRKIDLKNLTDVPGFVAYIDAASDAGYNKMITYISEKQYMMPFTPITRRELMWYIPYDIMLLGF